MSEKIIKKLRSSKSQLSVDIDAYTKVNLNNKQRLLPYNEINKIVNVGEVFDGERQTSTCYRFVVTVSMLPTNVLFNVTGQDSYASFMDSKFRNSIQNLDGSNPDLDKNLTYSESIRRHLIEKNGWYGYVEPELTVPNCSFYDMSPKRDKFSVKQGVLSNNWDVTLTYPYMSATTQGDITDGGLLIVDVKEAIIGGRSMVALGTPVRHGLTQGDTVILKGMSSNSLDGSYTVVRIGLDNGDLKSYYFVLDITSNVVSIGNNSRMVRVFANQESVYYFRKYKIINSKLGNPINSGDLDVFKLAFSKTIYGDDVYQIINDEEVDILGLTDNLGRPLSEIYITLIKTDSGGDFSNIASGLEIPFIENISNYPQIPDIRRIHNGGGTPVQSHTPLDFNVRVTDGEFYGDVVEYNKIELREKVLGEVYHRFNTVNRENGGTVNDGVLNSGVIDLGIRQEGYYYKPYNLIKIREFSPYIEQGDSSTIGIPDYAEDLGDGRFIWRDLVSLGLNDGQEVTLDYPFLNGCHYIHTNICIPLKRQDPFGDFGLYYNTFPQDPLGDILDDKFKTNTSENAC